MSLSFPRKHSPLTKRKTNTFPAPGFQLFPADLTVLALFFRLSRELQDPKTIAHSCIRNAFPNVQINRPKPKAYTRSQSESPKTNPYLNPQHISEHKYMPDAGAICPDPQRISKATNKRAPGSYLNKGSIVRVWRAAPFSTGEGMPSSAVECYEDKCLAI